MASGLVGLPNPTATASGSAASFRQAATQLRRRTAAGGGRGFSGVACGASQTDVLTVQSISCRRGAWFRDVSAILLGQAYHLAGAVVPGYLTYLCVWAPETAKANTTAVIRSITPSPPPSEPRPIFAMQLRMRCLGKKLHHAPILQSVEQAFFSTALAMSGQR